MPYAKCKDASIVAAWAVGGEVRSRTMRSREFSALNREPFLTNACRSCVSFGKKFSFSLTHFCRA